MSCINLVIYDDLLSMFLGFYKKAFEAAVEAT